LYIEIYMWTSWSKKKQKKLVTVLFIALERFYQVKNTWNFSVLFTRRYFRHTHPISTYADHSSMNSPTTFPSNKQNLSWATTRFSEYTHIYANTTPWYTNTYANTALVHTFHFPWLSLNSPYTNCCIHKPFQSLSSNSFISFSKFSVNSCSTSTHVKCLLTTQTNNNNKN